MTEYNGHRSWNAWNVSLWIGNDEYLYGQAVEAVRKTKTFEMAVNKFFRDTGLLGEKTPDGGIYNRTSVTEALRGLEIKKEGN